MHALVLMRTATRAQGPDAAQRRRDLDRLTLALAAHDPERTLARGYALAEDRCWAAAHLSGGRASAADLRLRFHDGSVDAEVKQ